MAGEYFEDTKIPIEDAQEIYEAAEALVDLYDNTDDKDALEQNRELVRQLIRLTQLLEQHNSPENEEALKEILEAAGLDTDTYQEIFQKIKDNADKIGDPTQTNPDFFDDIDDVKELFDKTQNMDGLSDDEKIAAYEAFFEAYYELLGPYLGSDEFDELENYVNRLIGTPDSGFTDKGAEYIEIKARQLEEKLDAADDYSKDDARAELMEMNGGKEPTADEITEHYLDRKEELYQEAERFHRETQGKMFLQDDDIDRMERQAGYNQDHIDRQYEAIKNEREALEHSRAREMSVSAVAPEALETNAQEFAALVTTAENYEMEDGHRAALAFAQENGMEDRTELTATGVENFYLSEKTALYEEAQNYYTGLQETLSPEDMAQIEELSGFSIGDVKNGIQTMELQSEELQIRIAAEGPVLEDQPKPGTIEIPQDLPTIEGTTVTGQREITQNDGFQLGKLG